MNPRRRCLGTTNYDAQSLILAGAPVVSEVIEAPAYTTGLPTLCSEKQTHEGLVKQHSEILELLSKAQRNA